MKLGPFERWAWLCVFLGALGGLGGCSPKIGDKCTISTDCSINGDRLCDPTQPNGYCTVFNCEPNKCPDESVCVAFNEPSCSSAPLSRRFLRTFCMLVCSSDSDCRAGYSCIDTTGDPLRKVVDLAPQSLRICAVPASSSVPTPVPMTGTDPAVCLPADAAPPTPSDAGTPDATAPEAAETGASDASDETTPEAAAEAGDDAPAE